MQPVILDGAEELCGLRGRPHRDRGMLAGALPVLDVRWCPHHRAGTAGFRELGAAGRVVGDQPCPDRGVQRRTQRRPDPAERGGRHRRPQRLVVAGDRGEHGLHVGHRQLGQQNSPQGWLQVQPHVPGVAADGGGGERCPRGQPMLQPLSRRNRPARLGRVRAAQGRQHRGSGLAGRVAAAAYQLPWRPPAGRGHRRPNWRRVTRSTQPHRRYTIPRPAITSPRIASRTRSPSPLSIRLHRGAEQGASRHQPHDSYAGTSEGTRHRPALDGLAVIACLSRPALSRVQTLAPGRRHHGPGSRSALRSAYPLNLNCMLPPQCRVSGRSTHSRPALYA